MSRIVADGFLSRDELNGKRVLVLGLGVSGLAVARALAESGAVVFASDQRQELHASPDVERLGASGVEIETGGHRRASKWLASVELVVPSPGISPRSEILGRAIADGVPILSEVELGSRFTTVPLVAVTGTNGKTTTCRMIGAVLSQEHANVVTCGNIGNPFITAAIDHPDADVFVVEVSSFQLTFCYAFHPHVAVVTNLAPDHLDWHGSMEGYRVAKARIAARQSRNDSFVYPAAQPDLADLVPSPGPHVIPFSTSVIRTGDGVWVDRYEVVARVGSEVVVRCGTVTNLAGFGIPFVEDGLACAAAALAFGAGPDAIAHVVESFRPDRHRIQQVVQIGGVRFVDDSKATNPHATLAALRGFERVVLICGGRGKGVDLSALRQEAARLRGVVAIGESAGDIVRVFGQSGLAVESVKTMFAAVETAFAMAQPGDVVLLSPACSSLDQFESYAQRGDVFQEATRLLAERERDGGYGGRSE